MKKAISEEIFEEDAIVVSKYEDDTRSTLDGIALVMMPLPMGSTDYVIEVRGNNHKFRIVSKEYYDLFNEGDKVLLKYKLNEPRAEEFVGLESGIGKSAIHIRPDESKYEKTIKYFARASKKGKNKNAGLEEQICEGVKRLKRKCLGILGHPFTFGYSPKTIKTLDEIGGILKKIGVSGSSEEGKEIIKSLDCREVIYGFMRTLKFECIDDKKVRISAHYYGEY